MPHTKKAALARIARWKAEREAKQTKGNARRQRKAVQKEKKQRKKKRRRERAVERDDAALLAEYGVLCGGFRFRVRFRFG